MITHVDATPPTPLTKMERQQLYRLFIDSTIAQPYHADQALSGQPEQDYHDAQWVAHYLQRAEGAKFKPVRVKR